jgi:hypothetical protein
MSLQRNEATQRRVAQELVLDRDQKLTDIVADEKRLNVRTQRLRIALQTVQSLRRTVEEQNQGVTQVGERLCRLSLL